MPVTLQSKLDVAGLRIYLQLTQLPHFLSDLSNVQLIYLYIVILLIICFFFYTVCLYWLYPLCETLSK